MNKKTVAVGLCVLVVAVSAALARCTPDWYAEIPCATDLECPDGYVCQQLTCVEGQSSGEPGFEVDKTSLEFGQVQVGETKRKDVNVKNSSPAGGRILISPSLSREVKDISLDPKAAVAVEAGATVKMGVVYKPSSAGVLPELYLVLTSDEPAAPLRKISITGESISPHLETDPTEITFDSVYRGATATPQRLRIMNTGVGPLTVNSITLDQVAETGFSLINAPTDFPLTIEGNDLREFDVGFRPMTDGKKTGAVVIHTNEYDNDEVTVALHGEGQACPDGFYDADGDPGNGCEYECRPKNPGLEVCDGEDNDCDSKIDPVDLTIDQLCPPHNPDTHDHATYQCSQGKCVVVKCDEGWQNWDKDSTNGCEAECKKTDKSGQYCTGSENGCGLEWCDGIDNDCNGVADDGVKSDMCPDRAHAPSKDARCEINPDTLKTECIYTCETGWDDCDGDIGNGCEQSVTGDVNNCGACGAACKLDHATPKCNGTTCEILQCEAGWENTDGDHGNGCEYECTKTTPDTEVCDGKDNDCDKQTDTGPIDTLCPPQNIGTHDHATRSCDKIEAKCKITGCDQGWYDSDLDAANGCECQAVSAGGGDSCGAAFDLGALADTGGSTTVEGNLMPPGKVEWFKFTGADNLTDDQNTGCDKYHVAVRFLSNPGTPPQYTFDVHEEACPASAPWTACDQFKHTTNFTGTDPKNGKPIGECPCTKPSNPSLTIAQCEDDTMTFWVKVYRSSGATATCDKFKLEISNGKYNDPP